MRERAAVTQGLYVRILQQIAVNRINFLNSVASYDSILPLFRVLVNDFSQNFGTSHFKKKNRKVANLIRISTNYQKKRQALSTFPEAVFHCYLSKLVINNYLAGSV